MSTIISRDRIEIKHPTTGAIVLDTDMVLPHVVASSEYSFSVPNLYVIVGQSIMRYSNNYPLFCDIQSIETISYPIGVCPTNHRLLTWIKINAAPAGVSMESMVNLGYMFLPGSLVIDFFRQIPGAVSNNWTYQRPTGGYVTASVSIDVAGNVTLLLTRIVAVLSPGFGITSFTGTQGCVGHDITTPNIVSDPAFAVGPVAQAPQATQPNAPITSAGVYPRFAELFKTNFTFSIKTALLRIT